MKKHFFKNFLSFLGLIAPISHFFCCALPAIIVAFAGTSVVGSHVAATHTHEDLAAEFGVPNHDASMILYYLSEYKDWIFLFSGIMLILSAYLHYRPKIKCDCWMNRISVYVLWAATAFYLYGIIQTYFLHIHH